MKKKLLILLLSVVIVALLGCLYVLNSKKPLVGTLSVPTREKPLLVYSFDNLKKTNFPTSQIILGDKIDETATALSQMFYFSVPERPNSNKMQKVSGVLNVPKKSGTYPIIVMFRGFIIKENYQPGVGTQRSAQRFAQNGFIILAPDFLGFGQSAGLSNNGFEDRFQTYTTALSLLSSLATLNSGLEASYSAKFKANTEKVGIWGHSNGGQIALALLAISGAIYPTVLWAPVSKPFPYSILYYTDEYDDFGKGLRKDLVNFEEDYEVDKFSPTNYYHWIRAPIEIDQGTSDQEIPYWWSDELVKELKKQKIDVKYLTYPGADHNFLPNSWTEAVLNSISFYDKYLKIP